MKEESINKKEVIRRFIENKYSQEDIAHLVRWIDDPGSDRSLKNAFQDYWYHHSDDTSDTGNDAYMEKMLDRLHHRINLSGDHPVSGGHSARTWRIRSASLKVFNRVAAIMFFPLLIVSLCYFLRNVPYLTGNKLTNTEIIYAPLGTRVGFDLPDGSHTWLNHGSEIRYSLQPGRNTREVYLTGEAYFDVKEDPEHPFVVNTHGVNVYAVGTSFNVMAYEDDPSIEVTLVDGKVDLYGYKKDGKKERITEMIPGDHVVIDHTTRKVIRSSGETNTYIAWKQGRLILRDDPMDIIVDKLEKWYNVDIEILDPQLINYPFTGTFTDETLPQVLNLLSIAVPLEYTIFPGVRQRDDTFTKSRVVLRLKK